MSCRENLDRRQWSLANSSGWPWRQKKKERRAKLENDAATKRLRLVMETDKERTAGLEKMVATTQLRLALEERRAKNGLDMILD